MSVKTIPYIACLAFLIITFSVASGERFVEPHTKVIQEDNVVCYCSCFEKHKKISMIGIK